MMRVLLVADHYPAYLEAFHARRDLAALPFAAHEEVLLDDHFGPWTSYRNWLRRIGHACELVVGNAWPLQQKWLDERRIRLRVGPTTKLDAVIERVAEMKPDILFVGSMFDYYGEFFRKAAQHARRIVTWIACPYPASLDFSRVSCVVSSVDAFVADFRRRGLPAAKLGAAFDEDIARRLEPVQDDVDVSFVGSLIPRTHRHRMACIGRTLAAGVPLRIWSHGLSPLQQVLHPRIARAVQGEAWGMDMYRTLARSRITLNFHIDVARRASFAGNMRTYEATGCGALLLTDAVLGASQPFAPGEEIETYVDADELVEKIRFYLAHPAERDAIAGRGQRACLERHGYAVRIRELERILGDVG